MADVNNSYNGIILPNYENGKQIVEYLNESKLAIEKIISSIEDSKSALPSPIKSQCSMDDIISQLDVISQECEHASVGIIQNILAYSAADNENFSIEVLYPDVSAGVLITNFLNGTLEIAQEERQLSLSVIDEYGRKVGPMQKADAAFFAALAAQGRGTYTKDDKGDKYNIRADDGTKYEYNVVTGELIVNGVRPGNQIRIGVYFPSNVSNMSKLNTNTFIIGEGNKSPQYKYFMDKNEQVQAALNNFPNDTVLIVPQATAGQYGTGYVPVADDVVNSTKFIQTVLNQNEDAHNTISGFSAGVYSSGYIASNQGADVYDSMICMNGYIKTGECAGMVVNPDVLRKMDITVFTAEGDGTGEVWQRRLDALDYMNKNNIDAKIYTSSKQFYNRASNYNYDVSYVENDKFYGHGNGCLFAINHLDAFMSNF